MLSYSFIVISYKRTRTTCGENYAHRVCSGSGHMSLYDARYLLILLRFTLSLGEAPHTTLLSDELTLEIERFIIPYTSNSRIVVYI